MTEAELATEHSAILPKRKRNENMIAAVDEFIERQKTARHNASMPV
ncbi:MAG: hypothetical protein J6Y19_01560 [Kiritimatiellae bacterium]|nr:hypothetical protein [Kiritimatiellia bacterium]